MKKSFAMKKVLYIFLMILPLWLSSYTHGMVKEKETEREKPPSTNTQTRSAIVAPSYILGVPTLFDRLPRDVRTLLIRLITENNPQIMRQCWVEASYLNLKDNDEPSAPREKQKIITGNNRIINVSNSGVQIWNALDGSCIASIANEGFPKSFLRVFRKSLPVCNAQCTRVASLAPNNTVKLWDAINGSCIDTLPAEEDKVCVLVFSTQGNVLVTACNETAKVRDSKTGALLFVLKGHTVDIFSVRFDEKDTVIFTSAFDRTVRVWSLLDGTCKAVLKDPENEFFALAECSKDGTSVITRAGAPEGLLLGDRFKVWDVKTASICFATRFPSLSSLKFSTSDDRIIAHSQLGTKIWNLNGDVCFDFRRNIARVELSPDGTMLAVSYRQPKEYRVANLNVADGACWISILSHTIKILNVADGSCKLTLKGHSDPIDFIIWNVKQDALATKSPKSICIWDLKTGNCRASLPAHSIFEEFKFNSLGNRIAINYTEDSRDEASRFALYDLQGYCLTNCVKEGDDAYLNANETFLVMSSPNGQPIVLCRKELSLAECMQVLEKKSYASLVWKTIMQSMS